MGDCLTSVEGYNPAYGSVNYDCGDNCFSDWQADDGLDGSSGTDGVPDDAYYALCYEDEIGVIIDEIAYVCN